MRWHMRKGRMLNVRPDARIQVKHVNIKKSSRVSAKKYLAHQESAKPTQPA